MDQVTQALMFSSSSDEYETPDYVFLNLNSIFNFTLDPCASVLSHKVDRFYTIFDDGLSKDWTSERPFCNPPYSTVSKWVDKGVIEFLNNGVESVYLIPARTETKYWKNGIWAYARYVVFVNGRIKFINRTFKSYRELFEEYKKEYPEWDELKLHARTGGTVKKSSAPFPSAIAVFSYGDLTNRELDTLALIGQVVDLRRGLYNQL